MYPGRAGAPCATDRKCDEGLVCCDARPFLGGLTAVHVRLGLQGLWKHRVLSSLSGWMGPFASPLNGLHPPCPHTKPAPCLPQIPTCQNNESVTDAAGFVFC